MQMPVRGYFTCRDNPETVNGIAHIGRMWELPLVLSADVRFVMHDGDTEMRVSRSSLFMKDREMAQQSATA